MPVAAVILQKHGGCLSCRFRLDFCLLTDESSDGCRVAIECQKLGRVNDRLHCLDYQEGCGSPN